MLDWFRRLRRASRKLVLPSRDASGTRNQAQLNYSKLTFSSAKLLAQLALSEKAQAEQMRELAKLAPQQSILEALQISATAHSERYDGLVSLLNRKQGSVKESLAENQSTLDELLARSYAPAWHERLVGFQVVFGFIQDLHERLLEDQPSALQAEVRKALSAEIDPALIETILNAEIVRIPGLGDRLALFARSVVGDALLAIRDSVNFEAILDEPLSLDLATANRQAFRVLEPLTNYLIGQHSQRMDALGLTA